MVDKISLSELTDMASNMFGSIVKGVVDLQNQSLVVDADMHADEEQFLIDRGSKQEDLWGINLHPDKYHSNEFVEFDSMINIRPRQHNPSRNVLDDEIRRQIITLVATKVED